MRQSPAATAANDRAFSVRVIEMERPCLRSGTHRLVKYARSCWMVKWEGHDGG